MIDPLPGSVRESFSALPDGGYYFYKLEIVIAA